MKWKNKIYYFTNAHIKYTLEYGINAEQEALKNNGKEIYLTGQLRIILNTSFCDIISFSTTLLIAPPQQNWYHTFVAWNL